MLRELAEVIAKPLSVSLERSWRTREVPENWRKTNVTLVFRTGKKEEPDNYRPVCLTTIPGKAMAQLILNVISKQVEENKVIRSSQSGFTKRNSCLTNLVSFYDVMTRWIVEGRAVDAVYLNFSKTFVTVSYNTTMGKFRKCSVGE